MVDVEQWAEVRRLFFVRGLSQREIHRRTGLHRDTIRNAINSETPPKYERAPAGSKLDPFKDEIHRLLKADPRLPGQRVRELIAPLGFDGGKTIVDDYLRQVRPLFDPPRTFQRTIYRPGEICQFDLWEPAEEIAVGHGQTRRGWVVLGCLGYSRAGAGALVFSKEIPDLLFGIRRCLWRLGALPQTLVWDRQAGLHAGGGRPTEAFAAFCGQLRVGWHFCDKGDPQAKGVVERLQDFARAQLRARPRSFANELDYQAPARHLVRHAREPAHAQDAALPADRPADRGARGDGAAAGDGAGCRPAVGAAGRAGSLPALRHQRLQPRPAAGRPARRGPHQRPGGPGGRAGHAASWPAGTRGRSPSIGRSPRSSTPARSSTSATSAAVPRNRTSRSARWRAYDALIA